MSAVDFLRERFAANMAKVALVCGERSCTYGQLLAMMSAVREGWSATIQPGAVVLLEGDYSAAAIGHLLALVEQGCIVAPLSGAGEARRQEVLATVGAEKILRVAPDGVAEVLETGLTGGHPLYDELRASGHAGLVLLSSGTTGKSKAAVHDFTRLMGKYQTPRRDLRTLAFLMFDHIGGLDTLFYCLSNASTLVIPADRSPETVCAAVQAHRVEVLPVSPTFLNLLLLSEAHRRFDLSSLKYITYGSEVMAESTLRRCAAEFPEATILQKYGATEVGTLRSQSKSSDSVWVKIGGEGYQTRVVEGMLQIRAASSMLGYRPAPSPFTADGWFLTGDAVEVDGEYFRILGRTSEIINVGGEKVHPAQVEGVVQEVPGVVEVVVYGEKNPIMGNIVCARVTAAAGVEEKGLVAAVKGHCRKKLQAWQVPVRVVVTGDSQHGERFKKTRLSHVGNE